MIRTKILKAASTSLQAVLMMKKYASLLASIYYLFNQINLINNLPGLYRNDELVLLRNTTKQKTDRIPKDIIEIYKNVGFKLKMKNKFVYHGYFGRNI